MHSLWEVIVAIKDTLIDDLHHAYDIDRLTEGMRRENAKLDAQRQSTSTQLLQPAPVDPLDPPVLIIEPAPFSDTSTVPPILNGSLRLVRGGSLGRGGYANVRLGELCQSDGVKVKVAVKMFHVGDDAERPDVSRRISREVRVINGLSHPNILPFYGVCTELADDFDDSVSNDIPALVTAFCEGKSIDKYVVKHPEALRVPLMYDAAVGLKYLHSLDVVHGDVKPDNILVYLESGTPKAVVGDFGRSRVEKMRGFTTQIASSYLFVAPEISCPPDLLGNMGPKEAIVVTKPSDIYSFTITMLTVVSGKTPFYRKEQFLPVNSLTAGERPSRSDHECAEMCDELWELMTLGWANDPSARLQMNDVTSRLHQIIRGRPIWSGLGLF